MMFALVMSAEGQPKQVVEFQTVTTQHETAYKSFIREGKYKEAIAPLTTLINLIDTTTIYKVANISEAVVRQLNAPYYYDLACCYAVSKQKKQALKALEQAVALGYKDYNNMLYDNDEMPHNGNHRAFVEMNAIDLYNYVKTTGEGVNCRQLAISLCEVYLSMGIPARYVTCMPADPNDGECHVINAVWSSQLQKWLWIDPTNDAWVMDENGTMLSIAEVRERMINDQPLVLCETANWNHSEKQTKEGYLYGYMSKNLYYFVCKKYSRFNPESDYRPNPAEEDIRLIPVGFVNDNWKCDTTTDPDFFWAKPE
jgi:tetratricopeptide (TPR) repeat protein